MRIGSFCTVAAVCIVACAAQSLPPSTQKAPAKTAAPAPTGAKTAGAAKKAPPKVGSASVRKTPAKRAPVHAAARPRQLQPTAERYREIQDALVAKGYLKPEQANGSWDQNSIDALKKFQADQKLDASGKITSMSLIALGLGPKHDSAPLPTPTPSGNDLRMDQR
jgi:hypothetical protein